MEVVDVFELPPKACILGSKYEFKWKEPIGDCPARARARLCICGNQELMLEDDNTFAPVARMTTARILFSMAVQQDLDAEVSDISTAFPNAEVPDGKEVYMAIPQGAELYYKMDLTNKYLRVWQALYGLRKSPRAFNQHLHGWMVKQVFTQSKIDPCLYFREQNGKMLWVLVYVDDLFMVGVPALVKEFKGQLNDKFTMRHHGPISVYTGMEFKRDRTAKTGSIGMSKYVQTLTKEFLPVDIRPVSSPSTEADSFTKLDEPVTDLEKSEMAKLPYRRLVACLLWVSTTVRCDAAFTVKKLTQHFNNPGKKMWKSALKTLVYLNTVDIAVQYGQASKDYPGLKFYVDADYASDRDTRRSTSGVMAFHQTNMVNWLIKNQKSVALSTMEAEYMALCEASKEALYLRQLFKELGLLKTGEPAYLMEDNEAFKWIASDAKHHNRAKHIDVQYHFSRDCQQQGFTKVLAVNTQRQLADMLTKYVKPNILQRLTWVAFGYYPEFHLEDPKTPMVTKDGSQLLAPSRPVVKKPVKSVPKVPACLKLLPVASGQHHKWGILGPCTPDDWKPPPMKSGHSNTLSRHPLQAAAALAKRYATNNPHLSSMNSNSSIGKVH